MVSVQILRSELWEAMEELELALAGLPGADEETIVSIAERAGNSSTGFPPRPRQTPGGRDYGRQG